MPAIHSHTWFTRVVLKPSPRSLCNDKRQSATAATTSGDDHVPAHEGTGAVELVPGTGVVWAERNLRGHREGGIESIAHSRRFAFGSPSLPRGLWERVGKRTVNCAGNQVGKVATEASLGLFIHVVKQAHKVLGHEAEEGVFVVPFGAWSELVKPDPPKDVYDKVVAQRRRQLSTPACEERLLAHFGQRSTRRRDAVRGRKAVREVELVHRGKRGKLHEM